MIPPRFELGTRTLKVYCSANWATRPFHIFQILQWCRLALDLRLSRRNCVNRSDFISTPISNWRYIKDNHNRLCSDYTISHESSSRQFYTWQHSLSHHVTPRDRSCDLDEARLFCQSTTPTWRRGLAPEQDPKRSSSDTGPLTGTLTSSARRAFDLLLI